MIWWVLQHVAITAALAAVVALVCRFTRFGPVTRHALWMIVLIKFVTPPLVVWPWTVPDVLGIVARGDVRDARLDTNRRVTLAPASGAATDTITPAGAPENSVAGGLADRADSIAMIWPWALGLWAVGSICVLALEGVRIVRLSRRVRAAEPANPSILRRAGELSQVVGVRSIRVVSVTGIKSPAVWCLRRPVLLWPRPFVAGISDSCVDGLLVHELAHVKRGDHLVGWLDLAAGVVWWWNPLFWLVRSSLREQAELACDAWVIAALPNGRRAYAESLLALSGAAVPPLPASSLAMIGIHAAKRRVLERRLVMIMKGRAPLRLSLGALFAVALVTAATLPAWAVGDAQQQPPPTPVASTVPAVIQTTPPPPAAVASTVPVSAQLVTPPPVHVSTPVPSDRRLQTTPPPGVTTQTPRTVPVQTPRPSALNWTIRHRPDALPAEGQQLIEGFDKDREAIQQEADKKIEARREAVLKALQGLQDDYTKAGKLDEAIAIRDYLKAGGPDHSGLFWIRRR